MVLTVLIQGLLVDHLILVMRGIVVFCARKGALGVAFGSATGTGSISAVCDVTICASRSLSHTILFMWSFASSYKTSFPKPLFHVT